MEGFVERYKISPLAVIVTTKFNGELKNTTIPNHGIVDITYSQGANVGFQEISTNSKSVRFKEKEDAKKFFEKLNEQWFNL